MLLALDDGGSLSAAAEALHVTQPAVSKALGEIEAGLGQTLFARRGRGLRATPSGQRLLTLARKLEADLHRGAGDIASIVRGASGELLIGATNAAIARILPDAMAAMKREHPNVTISVRSHALSSLFNELRQGRLDLVIARATPGDKPGDLEGQLLLEQREVVVLSAQHPLARSGRVSWETLTSLAWIWEL
ncbi:MAG TPA: LysR family transcriptional regulator, partial [Burkholderiaceae bacterium]